MPGEAAPCPALGSAEAFPVPAAPGGSGLFWEPRGAGKPRCQLSGSPEAGRAEPASVVCRAGRTRRQELGRILEGENYISSSPCSILPGLLLSASALGAGRGGDPALLQEWQPGRAALSSGLVPRAPCSPPGTRWAQRRKTLQGGVSCSLLPCWKGLSWSPCCSWSVARAGLGVSMDPPSLPPGGILPRATQVGGCGGQDSLHLPALTLLCWAQGSSLGLL